MKFKTWVMKVICFTICFFAIGSFTRSQSPELERFGEGSNSPILHQAYLEQVKDEVLLGSLTNLQLQVARYDIKQSEVFDGIESYRVTFSIANNKVVVVYGPNGEIERSHECYKNIRTPVSILNEITSTYRTWKILENRYLIYYNNTGKLKKNFRVKLGKHQNQMWLEYDLSMNEF